VSASTTTPSQRSSNPLRRVLDLVNGAMAMGCVACLVVMVLLTIADVTRRSFAGKSIEGVNELGEVMMVVIVFLGVAYAEQRRAHVSMTLFVRRMKPSVAAAVEAAGLLLVVAIVAWMLWVTTDRALVSFAANEYRFGLVRIPIWPARAVIVLGLAAYLLQLVLRLLDDVRGAARGRPAATADASIGV
jgi:TRAP-type C4-dicarboxylate transport system permease small subunit